MGTDDINNTTKKTKTKLKILIVTLFIILVIAIIIVYLLLYKNPVKTNKYITALNLDKQQVQDKQLDKITINKSTQNNIEIKNLKKQLNTLRINESSRSNEISELFDKINTLIQKTTQHQTKAITAQNHNNAKLTTETTKKQISLLISKIENLQQTKKNKSTKIDAPPFELMAVDMWGSKPQASIRYNGKWSIVNVGEIRMSWSIKNINFDKEQILVVKNGREYILDKIR